MRRVVFLVAVFMLSRSPLSGSQHGAQQEMRIPELGITVPQGWQVLFRDGCHYAVPTSWLVGPGDRSAHAPDGVATITVASVDLVSWSGYKRQVQEDLHPWKVHEDGELRFWCEFRSPTRLIHMVALRNGPTACTGQIEISQPAPSAIDTLVPRIIQSVGPGTFTIKPDVSPQRAEPR